MAGEDFSRCWQPGYGVSPHGGGAWPWGHQLEIHQKESLARKTRYLYNYIYTFIDILHTTNSNLIVV